MRPHVCAEGFSIAVPWERGRGFTGHRTAQRNCAQDSTKQLADLLRLGEPRRTYKQWGLFKLELDAQGLQYTVETEIER